MEYEYEIMVSTSGRLYAGTDAKVFIKLFGTKGESEEVELNDPTAKRLFEAGSNDKFTIKLKQDIGVVFKMKIRHDNSGYYPGWHLNHVKITDKGRDREHNFSCKRWLAKDEGDKKIEVEIENKGMTVVKIDEMREENKLQNHTEKFSKGKFLLRRGNKMLLKLELAKPYDAEKDLFHIMLKTGERPREFNQTMIYVGRVDEFDELCQKWAFKVKEVQGKFVTLEVNCPVATIVSKYALTLENEEGIIYKHPNALYILFNPWCKLDDVYMEDEEAKKEYILRQHGAIFSGSSRYIYPRNWYFGQFEDVSLECAFELLEKVKATGRASPVKVSRKLSSLVNSCDNRGLLVGNWTGSYEGGKSPTHWTSSPPIFEEYMKSKKSVKYGQCWVFSALLTSVLRTLGIPCRSVTNFNSAHDTDENVSNDIYLDDDGKKDEAQSSDSIWNFHCWNDAWMARPDLKPGYGGWQAVDATPQERSGGLFQMGPCSLRSIKEGEVDLKYDARFVLAEVNSDVINWQKNEESSEWEVVKINRSHVGKKISTKAVGSLNRKDITNEYKFAENSVLERASVRKAFKKSGNESLKITPKVIEMKVRPENTAIEIGDDLVVVANIKNLSEKERKATVVLGGNIVRYNGVAKGDLMNHKYRATLPSNEVTSVKFTLKAEDYMQHAGSHSMIRFYVTCKESETGNVCTSSKLVEIKRPELRFCELPNGMEFEKEESFTIQFQNPLDADLTDCELHLDGTLMQEIITIPTGIVKAKTVAKIPIKLVPNNCKGMKSLLATFNSKQLEGLHASVKIRVS